MFFTTGKLVRLLEISQLTFYLGLFWGEDVIILSRLSVYFFESQMVW